MRIKLLLIGLGITGVFAVSTMLAQTTTTSPATKPATATASTTATTPKTATATASAPAATGPIETAKCLRCHPFDKVIEKSKDWKSPLGDKVNPHYYVPHDSKKVEDVPECLKCHSTHSLPPKEGEIDLKKMDVKWCYVACHHEKNFLKCDKCH